MKVYSVQDVARVLDVSTSQVRTFVRASLLEPERDDSGHWRFSFQDLVLLRTAKGLIASRIPARKIRSALEKLREQLPDGRPLSGLHIVAEGDEVFVRRGNTLWSPESGQTRFNFDLDDLANEVRPHVKPEAPQAATALDEDDDAAFEDDLEAEDWYGIGLDLESAAPEHARDAYRRALELDPDHVDARVNLGRLLHDAGQLAAAEANYRIVLERHPDHPVALYNLAVSLEDQEKFEEAIGTYRAAITVDSDCADAYFNLGRLLERRGETQEALRCLQTYRRLRREH